MKLNRKHKHLDKSIRLANMEHQADLASLNELLAGVISRELRGRSPLVQIPVQFGGLSAQGHLSSSALIHGGQEAQELPFILNSFHLSHLPKGHFLAL